MCLGNSGEVSIVLYYVVEVSNGVYEFFFFVIWYYLVNYYVMEGWFFVNNC